MYNANHRSVGWRVFLPAGDLLAVAVSFPISFWIVLSSDAITTPQIDRLTVLNCFFIAVLELSFFHLAGLNCWSAFAHREVMLRRLPAALFGSTFCYILLRTLASPSDASGHSFAYVPGVLVIAGTTFVLTVLMRLLIRYLEIKFLSSVGVDRVAFIGYGRRMKQVLDGLKRGGLTPVKVAGYFEDPMRPAALSPERSGYPSIGLLDDLRSGLESQKINRLIIDLNGLSDCDLERIFEIGADLMVQIMMIPWASDIWMDRVGIRRLGGIPLMVIYDLPIGELGNRILKRAVDLIGSLVGLFLTIPLVAVLAVMIKRESPGPVFYSQLRPGYRGKTFQIIKLRSMRLDANDGTGVIRAVADDPRRLRIGEFMRKWNLDEIPQFWNVLRGEMSLVGPRPEILDLIAELRGSLHGYNLRHLCKPGMTGWAAVNGLRGDTSLDERVKYDLYYIDHWSLMMDFRIMLLTLLPPKNAY